jgi:hypothetical protein
MSKIPTIAEQQLANLQPNKLDEDFMSRLLAATDGSLFELSDAEQRFENSLRKFSPRKLSSSQDRALLDILNPTPFHVDDKIVLFHKSVSRAGETSSKIRRFHIAAAAAVALLGSLAAWMTPTQSNDKAGSASNHPFHSPTTPAANSNSFVPATFNRNLRDTRDEGVIWNQSNRPHRVMRFTYMDRVTLKNEKGESIQVEQPREEYVIIPEKVD